MRARWEQQISAGLVAACPELEVLYTARFETDREELVDLLAAAFTWVALPERVFERAAEVRDALTARAANRAAGTIDLLVAATAELHGLTLVHYT